MCLTSGTRSWFSPSVQEQPGGSEKYEMFSGNSEHEGEKERATYSGMVIVSSRSFNFRVEQAQIMLNSVRLDLSFVLLATLKNCKKWI